MDMTTNSARHISGRHFSARHLSARAPQQRRWRRTGVAAALLFAALAAHAQQQQQQPQPPAHRSPEPAAAGSSRSAPAHLAKAGISCLMSPERVTDIGAPVIGVVAMIKVDTGDVVRQGELLIALRDEVENAGVRTAELRSRIDADEGVAAANLDLANQRLQRSTQLEQQGFVSGQSTEQARAEREVALQRLELARGQRQVLQRELGVVRAQLGQRAIHSPFNGVVVERFVNTGERVEDKPMLRIAMLDPLRVELVMPASRFGSVVVNDRITVQPELPNVAPVVATVTRIDKVIDGASNTFRVRLNLPNPGNRLPAGARCRVQTPTLAAEQEAAPKAIGARSEPPRSGHAG